MSGVVYSFEQVHFNVKSGHLMFNQDYYLKCQTTFFCGWVLTKEQVTLGVQIRLTNRKLTHLQGKPAEIHNT